GRHIDRLTRHVVLPAVVGTAQATVLVAAEPERDAAVGAELVHQRVAALGVAPRQQTLGEELDPNRRGVVLRQFLGEQSGDPVLPEELSHRSSGTRLREQLIDFLTKHYSILPTAKNDCTNGLRMRARRPVRASRP